MTLDRSKLKLTRVAIADLIPLQSGLRSGTVDKKKLAITKGEAVDAPLVFKASGKLYVADGHHTVEAAFQLGYKHIQARILNIGSLMRKSYELTDLAKKLRPVTEAVADPFRRECRVAERRLSKKIAKMLEEMGKKIAASVGEVWEDPSPGELAEKLAKVIPPDDQAELARELERLIEEGMLLIEAALEEGIAAIAADAGEILLAELMPDTYESLVDQVFDRAARYSKQRTGELIGKNARGTGELAETTRKRIRANITKGLTDNVGRREIERMLETDFGFSAERAELIAGTEIAQANSVGSHEGLLEAQASGLQMEHSWVCEEDACEICLANEAQGWIPLEEPFASGDLHPVAHPNCRCTEGARVVEPVVKSHLSSVLGTRESANHVPETGNGGSENVQAA